MAESRPGILIELAGGLVHHWSASVAIDVVVIDWDRVADLDDDDPAIRAIALEEVPAMLEELAELPPDCDYQGCVAGELRRKLAAAEKGGPDRDTR